MFDVFRKTSLHSPRLYRAEIERLYEKRNANGAMTGTQHRGVSLASVAIHANKFSKILAKTVKNGEYEFEPATVREIDVEGKKRRVYSLVMPDSIVHRAVTTFIASALEPRLSPSLYSYRRGLSWWAASSNFARFVRSHYREDGDIRTKGIYVLRRDIQSYTDSIPVDDDSLLWKQLEHVLKVDGKTKLNTHDWDMIKDVIRPEVVDSSGNQSKLDRGVPTGQPISCVIFNLYLHQTDHLLANIPGSYYARYCDDLLFAHPNPEIVHHADELLHRQLRILDLKSNEEKSENLFLNRAGRNSPSTVQFRGTTQVEFVGLRTDSNATLALSKRKARTLLTDLEQRAKNALALLPGKDREVQGRAVCAAINSALDPNRQTYHQKTATLIRKAVTDRKQLAQLDYQIARLVITLTTGRTNARDFREIPYKKLRSEWNLTSLEHARNVWGRR